MAPVTGAVADGEEDQLVLFSCLLNRFLAPRIPVDWIVGVLEELGASGMNQLVRIRSRRCTRDRLGGYKSAHNGAPG
jgi:hypothetical protein